MKFVILSSVLALTFGLSSAYADSVALTTVVQNDEKENLVADIFQKTLYVFDLDQNQSTPACVGDCAEVWPPYILSADEASKLQAPLGSVIRNNKKIQLTYDGRPVYTYTFDRKLGDDQGDGVGNVWHYIEIK